VLAAKAAIAQGADDVLVVFGDTPLVEPKTLGRLRRALADGAAVALRCAKTVTGVPPSFIVIQAEASMGAVLEARVELTTAVMYSGACEAPEPSLALPALDALAASHLFLSIRAT